MKELPDRQKLFIREYLVDLNVTQAAIRAGYSKKTAGQQGDRLIKTPRIKNEIQKVMDKRAAKVEITADEVLEGIKRVVARCEQAEQVLDREGKPTGEYTFKANEALRGYELLGKHLKLFTDKVEHSGDEDSPLQIVIKNYDVCGKAKK